MPYEPVLLARVNKPDSHRLEGYRTDGGYAAFERALREKKPADVVNIVKDSGLRGRGGARVSCGGKWAVFPQDHPRPPYPCGEAEEAGPGTDKNPNPMGKGPPPALES